MPTGSTYTDPQGREYGSSTEKGTTVPDVTVKRNTDFTKARGANIDRSSKAGKPTPLPGESPATYQRRLKDWKEDLAAVGGQRRALQEAK